MASLIVKPDYTTDDIETVLMFDHLGRTIEYSGLEGGTYSLQSNTLNNVSLHEIIADSGLIEDVAPTPGVHGGDFGHRTGRSARRA